MYMNFYSIRKKVYHTREEQKYTEGSFVLFVFYLCYWCNLVNKKKNKQYNKIEEHITYMMKGHSVKIKNRQGYPKKMGRHENAVGLKEYVAS